MRAISPLPFPVITEEADEFKNDKSNGFGVYTCTDGTVYEGIWVDDI